MGLYCKGSLPCPSKHISSIGGHQEKGRRGGTETVSGIIGLGRAYELAAQSLEKEAASHYLDLSIPKPQKFWVIKRYKLLFWEALRCG